MGPDEQLATILPTVIGLVEGIDAARLYDPTPCGRFTVHDVLDHVLVLGGSFAHWFRGEDAPDADRPDTYGSVPKAEFRRTMEDLLDAARSTGAMGRTITAPMGALPGETFARFVAFDGLVHGWDLARATGLPYELPADVVAEVDAFARVAITAQLRDGDTFAAETVPPPGATDIERLAAFSGRTVRGAPAPDHP